MVNTDLVANSAISAALGCIAMPDSGGFTDAAIAAPYVVKVPIIDIEENTPRMASHIEFR